MIFNPEESIDLHGFTATFVQYAYARTQSVFRKELYTGGDIGADLLPLEKQMIITLERYADIIRQAGDEMNPSVIAGYLFSVAQLYNTFYHQHKILKAESLIKKELRLQLNQMTAHVIKSGMALLGIRVPDRM
jgi:arginyl-tRNA synthetase